MNKFEHILVLAAPKITGDYEVVFMKTLHNYLVTVFGSGYWDRLIRMNVKQWDKGQDVLTAKEKKIKSLAKKHGIEGKDLALQLEKGSYNEHIYWLDWLKLKKF